MGVELADTQVHPGTLSNLLFNIFFFPLNPAFLYVAIGGNKKLSILVNVCS